MTVQSSSHSGQVPAIEVEILSAQLAAPDAPFLLDVREAGEVARCSIPGAVHIPLAQLPQQAAAQLPRDRPIVVHCHHGGRSARAVMWLRQNGFDRAANLTGGIDAWACRIDRDMERY